MFILSAPQAVSPSCIPPLHAVLLLCGLKPTPQLRGMTDLWIAKAMEQKESRVKIEVEWEEKGVKERVYLTFVLRSRDESTGISFRKARMRELAAR